VGTLYAAYDLLHRLGCRWFAPGELHEVVPDALEGIPDLDVTKQPHFLTRGFHAWEDRGNPEFLLWMARNRLDYWCLEQSNHPLMRKLGIRMATGDHAAQGRFLNPIMDYPYNHAVHEGDEGKPVDPYPLNDGCLGDEDGNGRLSYFEAHPEWFPLVKGERIPGLRKGGYGVYEFGTNFCSSNNHAVAEYMKNYVQALIDGPYRSADIIRFWVLDNGRWCECPECLALGRPTDRYLLLVHRLDEEIQKARADGRIHRPINIRFLVYHDVLEPPTLPLPENFNYGTCYATFFPIRRSYVHTFDDPACPINSVYLKQLEGWVKEKERHYRGQICVGEYYNISGFKSLPMCYMHTMCTDIPFYYKIGARHFHYMHVTTRDWGNLALTNYQMARQTFDVETDCEALWTDYFDQRYGPAAETMRSFYEIVEALFCNSNELRYRLPQRLSSGAKSLFPDAALRYRREPGIECDGPTFVEIVESAVKGRELIDRVLAGDLPDRVRARVLEDAARFTYGERTILYYDACVQAYLLGRAGRKVEARHHLATARRMADLLEKDTRSASVSSSHANASNAFEATRAAAALHQLEKLIGP